MSYGALLAIIVLTIASASQAIIDLERAVPQWLAATGSICTFQLICIKPLMTVMG